MAKGEIAQWAISHFPTVFLTYKKFIEIQIDQPQNCCLQILSSLESPKFWLWSNGLTIHQLKTDLVFLCRRRLLKTWLPTKENIAQFEQYFLWQLWFQLESMQKLHPSRPVSIILISCLLLKMAVYDEELKHLDGMGDSMFWSSWGERNFPYFHDSLWTRLSIMSSNLINGES